MKKNNQPFIGGNWKMHYTPKESVDFVKALLSLLREIEEREVVLFPPFTSLLPVSELIRNSNIKLGAQNMHWEEKGAFTGEISPLFLKEIGCEYVIIGHSERRKHFKEDDETINKKLKKALATGLKPVFCVGEDLKEREEGTTLSVIETQLKKGLNKIENLNGMVIAYEPVWAIGTGRNATPAQAAEVHKFIRSLIEDLYNKNTAVFTRIIYGGSVTTNNIEELMAEEELDGVLVGGASLKAEDFSRIVRFSL